ncbi:hypothetical protein DM02DRAFT_733711 [Periconia macrospinosa]|uniref:Uncharacterized protein n=1 Tax=Periconia macrospinosa TaxID=97972 RepID=A0A2V1D328_9PLEO|nr:hypothetical protein DM02DRAFT_733711 [Periconia macrospinosa]
MCGSIVRPTAGAKGRSLGDQNKLLGTKGCFTAARLSRLASISRFSFATTRTTSQCGTTCGDVYIRGLRDTGPKDHTAFKLHRTTTDAAADRRKTVPPSPKGPRALQANTVVVGLNIEYGKKGSRKAALSIWRTREFPTDDGPELRAVQVVAGKVFRDDKGHPTSHTDLRLRLRDFAYQELVQQEMGDWHQELTISSEQLCDYLAAAEAKMRQAGSLGQHSIGPGVKKRKRSETPPEEITAGDEARYIEREERAAKRLAQNDPDYEDRLSTKSSSE